MKYVVEQRVNIVLTPSYDVLQPARFKSCAVFVVLKRLPVSALSLIRQFHAAYTSTSAFTAHELYKSTDSDAASPPRTVTLCVPFPIC